MKGLGGYLFMAGRLPAYDVNLKIKDGFSSIQISQPVQNIQLALHASNPDGKLDNTVIDLSQAHLETGAKLLTRGSSSATLKPCATWTPPPKGDSTSPM